MRNRWPTLLGSLLVVLLAITVLWIGWSPDDKISSESPFALDSSALPENPPGLLYELRIANARKRFHMGEPIPISMCFSSTVPKRYRVASTFYGRIALTLPDRFVISPKSGFTDPMAEYLRSRFMVGAPGGVWAEPILGLEPKCIEAFLNEWVRFHRPGVYQVTAQSLRIEKELEGAEIPQTEWVEVHSQPVSIEIEPFDPKWEEAELAKIQSDSSESGEAMPAELATRLRFLGSEEALDELAICMVRSPSFEDTCSFGLIESSHRYRAEKAMLRAFADPSSKISQTFISTLAFLRVRDNFREWLPDLPAFREPPKEQRKATEALAERYARIHQAEMRRLAGELAMLLPKKASRVRRECLTTINRIDPELAARLTGGQPTAELTAEPQSPGIEVKARSEPPSLLDPGFREAVLEDLARVSPQFPLQTLTSLPDETLPGRERHFATQAKDHPWLFGHLLARYGTSASYHEVRRLWDRDHNNWGCRSQSPFLAYFLRVQTDEGIRLFRKVMLNRGSGFCRSFMPWWVLKTYPGAPIEDVVVEVLGDPDPELVGRMAAWLATNGSARVSEALWSRLEAWHSKWKGRIHELFGNPIARSQELRFEQNLGYSLVDALFTGQAWVLSNRDRERLRKLCIESRCRDNVSRYPNSRFPIPITIGQKGSRPQWQVGQYTPDSTERLVQKLEQYPEVTSFGWCGDRDFARNDYEEDRLDRARWFTEAQRLVERSGHRFLHSPPRGTCRFDDE